jgi:adenosylcobinamide kinase/adenosylcobinamide-phosphate guanylyltransferase
MLREVLEMGFTFITGGASSGKSEYALRLFRDWMDVTFIATGLSTDAEMDRRIAAHRAQRPACWETIEEPVDLISALKRVDPSQGGVIIDCLTMWISNLRYMEKCTSRTITELAGEVVSFLRCLEKKVVVVSNELGMSIIPDSEESREFRSTAGEVNQIFARGCEAAYLVVSGLGLKLK